jgi:putative ABC transport system permease protein
VKVLDGMVQDVRHGVRILKNSPGFAATASLSLAIAIGANTTIFSIANALLMRPPRGVASPSTLVDVGRTMGGSGFDTVSFPNYRDLRDRTTILDGLYASETDPRPMSLGGDREAERVYALLVTGNYFPLLGHDPALGRLLRPEDDRPGTPPTAVLSYELWQRRFSGDPSITSRTIVMNGLPFDVVGVASRGFQGTTVLRPEVWIPLAHAASAEPQRNTEILDMRQATWLFMGGRLRPGSSIDQARAEMSALGAALEREFPAVNKNIGYAVARSARVPGQGSALTWFMGLLMGIVGIVLLIACVNLAGMLLARATARRREIALRVAVGAGRWRVIRQIVAETAVLFLCGGAIGLLVSRWLSAVILDFTPRLPVPVGLELPLDWRVIGFTFVASSISAIVAALVPAIHATRADLLPALKADGLNASASRLRLRSAFVVAQIAMSLLLVIAAGLVLRSVRHAAQIDPGFEAASVDVISLDLSLTRFDRPAALAFARTLLARLRANGGIESATLAADLPLDGGSMSFGDLQIPGYEVRPGETSFSADWNTVEPGFFSTLRLPLLRGRDFTDADGASAPGVAIINEAFARRAWGDRDALGRVVMANIGGPGPGRSIGSGSRGAERGVGAPSSDEFGGVRGSPPFKQLTIVGIAADAHLISISGSSEPYIYVPFAQVYTPRVSLLVKTRGGNAVPQVRALMRELNPNLPITTATSLTSVTSLWLVPQVIFAWLSGVLGLVGLVLATIGVWGMTSYAVSRRTREIGIRMALGAPVKGLLRMIVIEGLKPTLVGVGLGLILAAGLVRVMETLLFGVSQYDPRTFSIVALMMLAVGIVATLLPAYRATRVDPIVTLRAE